MALLNLSIVGDNSANGGSVAILLSWFLTRYVTYWSSYCYFYCNIIRLGNDDYRSTLLSTVTALSSSNKLAIVKLIGLLGSKIESIIGGKIPSLDQLLVV